MRKGVGVKILQTPIEVVFTCIHCDEEIEIGYKEFEHLTNSDLGGIIYDSPNFKCPKCKGELYVGEAVLD